MWLYDTIAYRFVTGPFHVPIILQNIVAAQREKKSQKFMLVLAKIVFSWNVQI
jgi:hypothetical protein